MARIKNANIQIRITDENKQKIEEKAKSYGFGSLSEYLIFTGLNAVVKVSAKKEVLEISKEA